MLDFMLMIHELLAHSANAILFITDGTPGKADKRSQIFMRT